MNRTIHRFKRLSLSSGLLALLLVLFGGAAYGEDPVIQAAECRVDKDDDRRFSMQPVDGVFDEVIEDVTAEIPTDGLTVGFHTVDVRFQNSDDQWGIWRPLINDFRISHSNLRISGEVTVAAAKYCWDTEPGEDHCTSLEPADGVFDEEREEFSAESIPPFTGADLTEVHQLYVRVKDSNGLWGVPRMFPVGVYETPETAAAEFFIDVDPGRGSGVELPEVSPDVFRREDYYLFCRYPYLEYLAEGSHVLSARIMDQHGIWGDTESVQLDMFGPGDDTDEDGIPDQCECGDFNGDGFVNTIDARLIQRCSVGEFPCADLCDTTGEGDCNTIDARLVQRFAVGELTKQDLSCPRRPRQP